MLSTWNSISGPKVEHLWLASYHPYICTDGDGTHSQKSINISKECITVLDFAPSKDDRARMRSKAPIFHYLPVYDVQKCLKMSGKLLISEMEGKNPCTKTVSKLYVMGGYVICSVVFHKRPWLVGDTDEVSQCSCLSVMLKSDDFTMNFDVHRIIDLHLRKATSIMQRSIAAPSLVAEEVTIILNELCQVICAILNESELQPPPTHLFTEFQTQVKFLSRAISSHLQTCGFSVVTGDTKPIVCRLAQILLLFNNEQEQLSSNTHARNPQTQYYSGLHVQAIPRGRKVVFLPDVVFRDYPLSVIDADWQKVRQTLSDGGVEYNSNLLRTVTDGGALITRFVEDLIFVEQEGQDVKKAIQIFCRFLHMKAVALVKICERYRSSGHPPTQKQMMNLLNLQNVSDLKTLMGCAEKLQPGISSAIV